MPGAGTGPGEAVDAPVAVSEPTLAGNLVEESSRGPATEPAPVSQPYWPTR